MIVGHNRRPLALRALARDPNLALRAGAPVPDPTRPGPPTPATTMALALIVVVALPSVPGPGPGPGPIIATDLTVTDWMLARAIESREDGLVDTVLYLLFSI